MENQNLFDDFFNAIENYDLNTIGKKANLKFYLNFIFKEISFEGKSLIDIGAGSGLLSFYAAYMGANKVVLLEPESDGSSKDVFDKLLKMPRLISQSEIIIKKIKFQNYESIDQKFDIILLHNSINHLDETAYETLLKCNKSEQKYNAIFKKLSDLASPDATLIITDCSRRNFFYDFGFKNPFDPTIEWHKHQSPNYLKNILLKFGFINPKIRWISPTDFRTIGRIFFGNPIISYFTSSYFCLKMSKENKFKNLNEQLKKIIANDI